MQNINNNFYLNNILYINSINNLNNDLILLILNCLINQISVNNEFNNILSNNIQYSNNNKVNIFQ